MKKLFSIFILFCLLLGGLQVSYAEFDFGLSRGNHVNNTDLGTQNSGARTKENKFLKNMEDNKNHVKVSGAKGAQGLANTLFSIAKDMKNTVFLFATLFMVILVLILLIGDKPEEQQETLKKGIMWISLGIMTMQLAFIVHEVFFNRDIDGALGEAAVKMIFEPILELLMFLASFVFVTMGVWSFYMLVTANGDEDKNTKGKMIVLQAVIGFIVIKFSQTLIKNTFDPCGDTRFLGVIKVNYGKYDICADITKNTSIITEIITWINGFMALVIVCMILYAGFLILIKKGDEDAYTKAKSILLYSGVGVLVLFGSFIILNFLIGKGF